MVQRHSPNYYYLDARDNFLPKLDADVEIDLRLKPASNNGYHGRIAAASPSMSK
jgi:hypothetical protein